MYDYFINTPAFFINQFRNGWVKTVLLCGSPGIHAIAILKGKVMLSRRLKELPQTTWVGNSRESKTVIAAVTLSQCDSY